MTAGWGASRVLVPGTAGQLGALGLFEPPASPAVVRGAGGGRTADDGGLRALAADPALVWLDFGEVARAGAAGMDWGSLAAEHALWVVSGVPVLAEAPDAGVLAFAGLADVLRAADVPLVVVARADPGPLPSGRSLALPVERAPEGTLPRLGEGS